MSKLKRSLVGALCTGLVALAGAAPAQAAPPEPDIVLVGPLVLPKKALELENLCGIAVGNSGLAAGDLYISNYYHHAVDKVEINNLTRSPRDFETVLGNVDPLDGPCGLDFDSSGRLYVNDYHRNVVRYGLNAGPFETPAPIDSSHPTGVAVDFATNNVYVNARTYIAAYGPSGAPLLDGGDPLRIGEGSLLDGYGLAVSRFPATAGWIYAPDYADNTVKVYNPAVDVDDPVQTITGPPGGFNSLRDSAVAVDKVTGVVYVVDTLDYPQFTEFPQAVVHVFDSTGAHKGRLKYNILDPSPAGLAVDNSNFVDPDTDQPTQGRVYVTSGNTTHSGIYGYPPGSATGVGAPGIFSLAVASSGSGDGSVVSQPAGIECDAVCEEGFLAASQVRLTPAPEPGSTFAGWSGGGCEGTGTCVVEMSQARTVSAAFEALPLGPPSPGASASAAGGGTSPASSSAVVQKGNLRVAVSGRMAPRRLPRDGVAPISVSVGGEISTTDRTLPPQLKTLRIELNRHGRIDSTGLPTCDYDRIQPGSSSRALAACRLALIGRGSFTANITLAGQEPYPTKGALLVFNGRKGGKPVLFGHIYSGSPFATSFVIVFEIQKLRKGAYGTALNAPLPKAMDAWGRLTSLEMTLSRRYSHRGERRSFISAGCPAPKGFRSVPFPLARTSFAFEGGKKLSSTLTSTCSVRG
jgi:hypothetical protein